MCVCVFGIYVLKIVVERWFWELKMLIGSLVELHAWLHSYLCFSLLEKLFLNNLNSISTPGYLSSFLTSSYSNLDSFSTARWIYRETFCPLDSFSIHRGWLNSISTPLDWSKSSCMHCFSNVLHLSIILSSIASCNVHAFIWISLYPLIILDHLYVSRVKLFSFLYLLSIMTKRGRNCGEYEVSF